MLSGRYGRSATKSFNKFKKKNAVLCQPRQWADPFNHYSEADPMIETMEMDRLAVLFSFWSAHGSEYFTTIIIISIAVNQKITKNMPINFFNIPAYYSLISAELAPHQGVLG